MKVDFELEERFVSQIENAVSERLKPLIEEILSQNIDDILTDVVHKQLKSCALIYIQSPEFRQKMMDKVKPQIDSMISI